MINKEKNEDFLEEYSTLMVLRSNTDFDFLKRLERGIKMQRVLLNDIYR